MKTKPDYELNDVFQLKLGDKIITVTWINNKLVMVFKLNNEWRIQNDY